MICNRWVPTKVKGKILQDCSETSFIIWAGDGGTDKKAGGRAAGGFLRV